MTKHQYAEVQMINEIARADEAGKLNEAAIWRLRLAAHRASTPPRLIAAPTLCPRSEELVGVQA